MSGRVWAGLILIVVGFLLLLEAFGVVLPSRTWSLLFLFPAAFAVVVAWRDYSRAGGRVTWPAAAWFTGAVVLALLTLAILLDIAINWNVIGPIALILVGGEMVLRWMRTRS